MSASKAAWERLGELLEQRRVEIDTRYTNLRLFTDEAGIDYRLAWDLEHAARVNYRRPTLTAVEVSYRWRQGSIAAVLAGGQPVPLAGPGPLPQQHDVLGQLLASHGVRSLDEVPGLRQVWQISDEDLSEHARLGMIEVALKMRDHRIAEDERSGERRRNSA